MKTLLIIVMTTMLLTACQAILLPPERVQKEGLNRKYDDQGLISDVATEPMETSTSISPQM